MAIDHTRARLLAPALLLPLLLLAAPSLGQAPPPTPAPAGARVYFLSPQDGARVASPVLVRIGLSGMGVAPAGVEFPNTGHHHLVIDAPLPEAGVPIPADARHIHLGGGQTEVSVVLEPGPHTLKLVLGDHLHRPHLPPVASDPIEIVVE